MSSQTPDSLQSPSSPLDSSPSATGNGPSVSDSSQRSRSPEKSNTVEREDAQPTSSRAALPVVTVSSSTPKETKDKKKKVGFASNTSPPKETHSRPEIPKPEPTEEDYFSHTPLGGDSAGNTPGIAAGDGDRGPASRRDSFDRDGLTEALEKILKPEDHSGPQVANNITLTLPRPRPALRKSVYPESPAEPVLGFSHPSEVEARNRAGRLAESVSGLASRTSFELDDESEFVLLDHTDVRDHARTSDNSAAAATGSAPDRDSDAEGLIYRRKAQSDADRLVRGHTQRRARREYAMMPGMHTPDIGARSGASTPVAYDLEYVPPAPTKYLGGIMGSLLRLYAEERQGGSGTTTPDSRTPNRTPNRTPRNSPPTTSPGTPSGHAQRPRHGLFGLGSRHSASTLAELIGSTSSLAVPASSNSAGKDLSDHVSGNLKKEREKKAHTRKSSKSHAKEQQILVTKHIAQIISRHRYLVKLCKALMEYGAPTHRLEAYMAMSARVLAVKAQFLYLPGTMIISFDDESTHTTEVKIVRALQGVSLGKLRDVHEIYKLVVHDLISVEDAMYRLDSVVDEKDKFNKWLRVGVYGLAAVGVAPFAFSGRWIDLPIAFVMGSILGIMQLVAAPSSELYNNVFEISAALIMAFLGRMFGSIKYNGENLFCFSALAQSSIALILPGYMVLCGSLELQNGNMVAGSVRLVYAMIYTLFLGYGITIGATLYGLIDSNASSDTTCQDPLNSLWHLFFVPLFTICLCIINQAKWKQMPVQLAISFAGYVVNSYSNTATSSSTISNTLGALTIGVLANMYSRVSRHVENFFLDVWELKIEPRISGKRGTANGVDPELAIKTAPTDAEGAEGTKTGIGPTARRVGYGLAAAAMLPAIFVQVPSGLASGGSLVAGITSANAITGNSTAAATSSDSLNSSAFQVLGSVIQVAISISVGLAMAALIVYPFGKRRSGLFSF
ncbi:unnamed protein product [Discula destructiva]